LVYIDYPYPGIPASDRFCNCRLVGILAIIFLHIPKLDICKDVTDLCFIGGALVIADFARQNNIVSLANNVIGSPVNNLPPVISHFHAGKLVDIDDPGTAIIVVYGLLNDGILACIFPIVIFYFYSPELDVHDNIFR